MSKSETVITPFEGDMFKEVLMPQDEIPPDTATIDVPFNSCGETVPEGLYKPLQETSSIMTNVVTP